jgi:hypothetical protein
MERHKFTQV